MPRNQFNKKYMKPLERDISAIFGTMKKAKTNEKVLYFNHTIQHEKALFLSFSPFIYRHGNGQINRIKSKYGNLLHDKTGIVNQWGNIQWMVFL